MGSKKIEKVSCPLCHKRLVHLPKHMHFVHKFSKSEARYTRLKYNLRKKVNRTEKPKFKDYHYRTHCPVEGCAAIVKRITRHIEAEHGLSREQTIIKYGSKFIRAEPYQVRRTGKLYLSERSLTANESKEKIQSKENLQELSHENMQLCNLQELVQENIQQKDNLNDMNLENLQSNNNHKQNIHPNKVNKMLQEKMQQDTRTQELQLRKSMQPIVRLQRLPKCITEPSSLTNTHSGSQIIPIQKNIYADNNFRFPKFEIDTSHEEIKSDDLNMQSSKKKQKLYPNENDKRHPSQSNNDILSHSTTSKANLCPLEIKNGINTYAIKEKSKIKKVSS